MNRRPTFPFRQSPPRYAFRASATLFALIAGGCVLKGTIALADPPVSAPESKPLTLRNAGMEEGSDVPATWDVKLVGGGKINIARDTTTFKAGAASLRVESVGGATTGQASQMVEGGAGRTVTVSGFLKTSGAVRVNFAVQPFDADGNLLAFLQIGHAQGNSPWASFSKSVTLPPKTARFGVGVLLDGDGKAWLDEVNMSGDKVSVSAADADVIPPPVKQDPTIPQPGYWAAYPEAWLQTHNNLVAQTTKGDTNLVFIGDSITQGWGEAGKAEWDARFAPKGAINLGIGGDRTSQLLWRIDHGALDGFTAKLVVVKIGVNNLWYDEFGSAKIAEGIAKVVGEIREKQPKAKVLVLGILPTMQDPANGLRAKVKEVNALSAKRGDGKTVRFLDIGAKFLEPDGTLSKDISPDFVHLSPKGYKIFADAIEPTIAEMMK